MFCAVVGQRFIWFFNARNKTEGRKIANDVLFFENLSSGNIISFFSPTKGYCKAVGRNLENVKDLLKKVEKSKIVEIKRRRAPEIDAIYVTRMQKERWATKTSL